MQAGKVRSSAAAPSVDYSASDIGAAAGGAGAGAAIGGGVGALSGGRARERTAVKIYWAAYRDCMAGRIR